MISEFMDQKLEYFPTLNDLMELLEKKPEKKNCISYYDPTKNWILIDEQTRPYYEYTR